MPISATISNQKQKLVTRTLTLPTGERKYFRGKTVEEAEQKVWEAKRLLGIGIKLNDQTTFGEFAELWYKVYKKPRLKSPNSQAAVLNILNHHLLPVLTAYPLKEITPTYTQIAMNKMEGQSASLRNKALQALKGIFTTAVENGLIIKSPIFQSIKAGGKCCGNKNINPTLRDSYIEVTVAAKSPVSSEAVTYVNIYKYMLDNYDSEVVSIVAQFKTFMEECLEAYDNL